MDNVQNPSPLQQQIAGVRAGVAPSSIREGSESAKTDLWYGDDKTPTFINLSNATKMKMEGSLIRVFHGREFVDIDCQNLERSRFLFGTIVQHLIDHGRVVTQPRELTQEEKDAFQKQALSNGHNAVPQSPELSGIDPQAPAAGGPAVGKVRPLTQEEIDSIKARNETPCDPGHTCDCAESPKEGATVTEEPKEVK